MDHIKQRWADTQMAPPYGLGALHDLRQPEAAHAASELDEWEPMTQKQSAGVWFALLGVPAAVIVIGLWVALS